jgi:hypothetical protein
LFEDILKGYKSKEDELKDEIKNMRFVIALMLDKMPDKEITIHHYDVIRLKNKYITTIPYLSTTTYKLVDDTQHHRRQ